MRRRTFIQSLLAFTGALALVEFSRVFPFARRRVQSAAGGSDNRSAWAIYFNLADSDYAKRRRADCDGPIIHDWETFGMDGRAGLVAAFIFRVKRIPTGRMV